MQEKVQELEDLQNHIMRIQTDEDGKVDKWDISWCSTLVESFSYVNPVSFNWKISFMLFNTAVKTTL